MNLSFIWGLAKRELSIRYKSTFLGFFWSILHPLILLTIFTAIFSQVFVKIENYPLYIVSGLLFWIFFSTTTNQLLVSILSNARFIKSFEIPRLYFPLSTLLSGVFNFMLSLIPFFGIMLFLGFTFRWATIQLIPVIILFSTFSLGVGLLLCSFNVFFRDVNLLWSAITPMLFYSSPIAYNMNAIPEHYRKYFYLNPLVHFLETVHTVVYNGDWVHLSEWGIITGITSGTFALGFYAFKKLEKGFISYL